MCDNQNFETTAKMNSITELDIQNILEYFSKNTYGAKVEDNVTISILERCTKLLEIDYSVLKVSNKSGELCPQYPSQLLILENENSYNQNSSCSNLCNLSTQRITETIYENIDLQKIRDQFSRAKYARCRQRFPIPTILYRGKYVCRSSTLSGGPEIYGRSSLEFLGSFGNSATNNKFDDDMDSSDESDVFKPADWQLFDKVRSQDIKLLKRLNIGTIVDLMVEKKKVKFGMYVTSSEKVDKENRYSDFNIISLPYPGCEFFKDFRDNNYAAEGLRFDWNQEHCDATISVPDNHVLRHLRIEWNNYKQWDLIHMTQNYIKYLLKYLQDNTSGILIHCISGWDRTPLFISLLRMSMWADGLIHQGLNDYQILYLTITYDWMLFGHRLLDRLAKGEEIFFFCFYMLKYLTGDEFSIAHGRYKHKKFTEKLAEDVPKAEYEPVADLLFDQEHLTGSNVSLNSICSTVSNKSQELFPWYHNSDEPNGNLGSSSLSLDVRDNLPLGASASPQARRTSPVTVPTGTRMRRTDSSTTTSSVHSNNSNNSSNSTGSWQVVTATGSLKGSSDSTSNCGDIPFAHSSICTIIDGGDECTAECQQMTQKNRVEKLVRLRKIFYAAYYKTIGKDVKMGGQEASIGAMICNVVEKVFPKDPK